MTKHNVEIRKMRDGRFTYAFKRADGTTWVSSKAWVSRSQLARRLAESGMVVVK